MRPTMPSDIHLLHRRQKPTACLDERTAHPSSFDCAFGTQHTHSRTSPAVCRIKFSLWPGAHLFLLFELLLSQLAPQSLLDLPYDLLVWYGLSVLI